ncbi:MAG TPA: S41 family peptidase, partial [Blastocatellia bacterium]|nr:S41 family peptidase [Blastocatellia bacterium]
MRSQAKMCLFAAISALILTMGVWGQNPAPSQTVIATVPAGEKTGDVRQQTFDMVWSTVKDKHFDPNFGGVDWNKVREQYSPRVAEVKSDAELYRLLQQMLGELHQSHFNIVPPEAVIPDETKDPPAGGVGLNVRLIGGAAVINSVEPGSSAAQAGIRPGFVIQQVGEKTVQELTLRYGLGKASEALRQVAITRRVMAEINGEPGSTVKIVFLDEKDQPQTATLTRNRLKGELSPRLGNFPPQYTEFESKRLPNAQNYWGYIRFNIFTTPITEKARTAIREFHDADGLIFDLRGNPGGVAGIALSIANQLSDKAGLL